MANRNRNVWIYGTCVIIRADDEIRCARKADIDPTHLVLKGVTLYPSDTQILFKNSVKSLDLVNISFRLEDDDPNNTRNKNEY